MGEIALSVFGRGGANAVLLMPVVTLLFKRNRSTTIDSSVCAFVTSDGVIAGGAGRSVEAKGSPAMHG